jgi:hypothetical protein
MVSNLVPTPGDFRIVACIQTERLLSVALSGDLLLTPDEFDHLEACRNCLDRWGECIAEAGRRLQEHD